MSREILIEYNFEFFILFYSTASEEIPDSAFCAMLDNPESFPLWEVSTCVFFAFPMMIMVVLYSRMGLKIRSRSRHTLALGKIRLYSPFSHSMPYRFAPSFFNDGGSLFVSIKVNCYYLLLRHCKQIALCMIFLCFYYTTNVDDVV